jgi:hypothetical protein
MPSDVARTPPSGAFVKPVACTPAQNSAPCVFAEELCGGCLAGCVACAACDADVLGGCLLCWLVVVVVVVVLVVVAVLCKFVLNGIAWLSQFLFPMDRPLKLELGGFE